MKTLFALGTFIVLMVITAIKRAEGRKNVRMLEEGKMCVYCRSTNVFPGQAGVTCQNCGQTTLWTLIKQPSLSQAEMDNISERDRRSPFR